MTTLVSSVSQGYKKAWFIFLPPAHYWIVSSIVWAKPIKAKIIWLILRVRLPIPYRVMRATNLAQSFISLYHWCLKARRKALSYLKMGVLLSFQSVGAVKLVRLWFVYKTKHSP